MPRKKIKDLTQVHGKIDNQETKPVPSPSTLDQLWGDTGYQKYNTLDKDVYVNWLNELNMSDLQSHATKLGVIPIHGRERLMNRLIAEFLKHINSYNMPAPMKIEEASKEVLAIMGEAK